MNKKTKKYKTKPLDILIIAVSMAVTASAFISAYKGSKGRAQLLVQTPYGIYAYDMTQDRTIDVQGELGTSRIQISGGKARFLESPCPNKTCIQCAPISRTGEWTACLPNRVFIRIDAGSDDTVDALSQ
jgi:hypothetical protein